MREGGAGSSRSWDPRPAFTWLWGSGLAATLRPLIYEVGSIRVLPEAQEPCKCGGWTGWPGEGLKFWAVAQAKSLLCARSQGRAVGVISSQKQEGLWGDVSDRASPVGKQVQGIFPAA